MTLLLLAGTSEARRIAWGLADRGRRVVASLAGVTRRPEPLPVPTRVGGFGGEAGFRAYLAAENISAVLDATHPFAERITARTARVCGALGLPYAQVLRPPWAPGAGDRWTMIDAPDEAAAHLPDDAVVFLATGRQTLPVFANLEGRRVLARVVDPPNQPFPFAGGEFVIARPPFKFDAEVALFKALGVTHLVAKNAGGAGGLAKLAAARALGCPVVMLNRPQMPDAVRVETVAEAVAWVEAL
ncbi:cobalt-precorrin-6A reductase [Thalassorhabdomicrobium marinisediminis]|uniref:cobalt-precorrin-6A reductase n=1 Tax=Thalassorhabdomicrobium marinisediminis TaxID=2170577 RepID=UPI0024919769|nr:cobalt-precorrin-6A reductase [Thalassorhabdomicrobium marinisediminis]